VDDERKLILQVLKAAAADLRARGVQSLSLSGSMARGTARPDSDIDVVVDLDPAMSIGVFEFVGIQQGIEARVGRKTDLLERRALRPEIRASLERDAIFVF
jgi:predicted nucleotidyltransferase